MNRKMLNKTFRRGASIFIALVLSVSALAMNIGVISLQAAMSQHVGRHVDEEIFPSDAGVGTFSVDSPGYPLFGVMGIDFEIPLELAKKEKNFVSLGKLIGYRYSSANEWTVVDMHLVNAEDVMNEIQSKGPGKYNVSFRANDMRGTYDLVATVTDSKISLSANDVILSAEEAAATNVADMLHRSEARASTENKIHEHTLVVDPQTKEVDGFYEVTDAEIAAMTISDAHISAIREMETAHTNSVPMTIEATDTAGDRNETQVNVYVINDEQDFEFTADTDVSYDCGAHVDEAQFLRDAGLKSNRVFEATSNFTEVVRLDVIGPYVVTISGRDVVTGEERSVKMTVLVTDEYTSVDETRETMMRVRDFTVKVADVPAADFVVLAEAKAWDIIAGAHLAPTFEGEKPETAGLYSATFSAGRMMKTVQMKVVDEYPLVLTAEHYVIYQQGEGKTEADFLNDIEATLNGEDDVRITTDFATAVDVQTRGAYSVKLQATDGAGNTSNVVQTTVFVKDKDTIVDEENDVMLAASDFTINLSVVADADFIALARAEAWQLSTGDRMAPVFDGAKPKTGGIHELRFNAGLGTKAVEATIIDDVPPVLILKPQLVYSVGKVKTEEKFLRDIGATLDEIGTITSDFKVSVDFNNVGIYVVTVQAEDAVGNKSEPQQARVIVKDKYSIVDESRDTMIRARSFSLLEADVASIDYVAYADAKAWRLSTGEELTLTVETVEELTEHTYKVRFAVGRTKKNITITITIDTDMPKS
jgi:hypothetical protein